MAVQDPSLARAELAFENAQTIDAARPAVSWGAIFAGAFAAAAISFILLSIGAAFGLSVTSPWDFSARNTGEAAAAIGISTAIFLVIVHAISSGIGGYLAGRLRTKIVGVRGDETYFRDTAHGLVVWAVSAVIAVLLIGYLAMAAAQGTVEVGTAALNATGQAAGGALTAMAPSAANQARGEGPDVGYFVDSLFRPGGAAPANTGQANTGQANTGQATGQPATGQPAPQQAARPATEPASGANARLDREETERILRMALAGDISADDKGFVTQLVARETGMSQQQAEQRVNQVIDRAKAAKAQAAQKAKEAADAARKAGAYTALWAAVTMLVGAFCASLAATWGGWARDR